jgi:antitoxin MazE
MKAKLVRIGNSRGIRLPKPLIEEAKLCDEVDIVVSNGAIIISSPQRPRAGWSDAAKRARTSADDRLTDPPTRTKFDETEWEW